MQELHRRRSMSLLDAARRYVTAREVHTSAARDSLAHCLADLAAVEAAEADPEAAAEAVEVLQRAEKRGWTESEVIDSDGIALTIRCEREEGVRYRWKMPTAVEQDRAERALREAVAAAESPEGPLHAAAADLLAELEEPFCGYAPDDIAGKERSEARMRRHNEVFVRLREMAAA